MTATETLLGDSAVFGVSPFGCTFTVYGTPAPGGGKIAGVTKNGRRYVRPDNPRTAPWRDQVQQVAGELMSGSELFGGPLMLVVKFYTPRPKSHYGKNGVVASAPKFPAVRPDLTKLIRPLEDALKNIVWLDDAQIVTQYAEKRYGEPARAEVSVTVIAV